MRKLVLVLALCLLVPSCGAELASVGAGVVVGVDVAKWSCEGAHKLCELTGNDASKACQVISEVCTDVGILAPVIESLEPADAGIDAP